MLAAGAPGPLCLPPVAAVPPWLAGSSPRPGPTSWPGPAPSWPRPSGRAWPAAGLAGPCPHGSPPRL